MTVNEPADSQASFIEATRWRLWQRLLFRFAFCFWSLFCLSRNLIDLVLWFWPWLEAQVEAGANWPLRQITLWVGRHLFHLSGVAATFHPTGSGDTALSWISFLVLLAISLAVSTLWSVVSEVRHKRLEYRTLTHWLRLAMRFALADTLLSYGFIKIFPIQFPNASGERLTVTYAASSPMGLLWRFMGSSTLYRIFGGLAEIVPGVLLFFQRTTTLGALGATAVLLNVVALNFGYDVSVKLYSCELLLMAFFLLAPDLPLLFQFFVQRREVRLPSRHLRPADRRPLRIATYCIQALTIGSLLYSSGITTWQDWHSGQTPLVGAWKIESAAGSLTTVGWTSLSTNSASAVKVFTGADGNCLRVEIKPAQQTISFFGDIHDPSAATRKPVGVLRWTSEQNRHLALSGTWQGQPASLTLLRIPPDSALETRGFHLVQEFPFNR